MSRVYVYALVDRESKDLRIGGRPITFLRFKGIYAAVNRGRAAPPATEARLRQQHTIVSSLAKRFDAVLPARFGAWLDPGELARIIDLRRHAFERALAEVRGCEQMTLRVFGSDSSRDALPIRARTGTSYLRRRAPRKTLPRTAEQVRKRLQPFVRAETITSGRGDLRAVVHHLIERGRSAEYIEIVRQTLRDDAGITLTVSGPFPPFAFAPDIWS